MKNLKIASANTKAIKLQWKVRVGKANRLLLGEAGGEEGGMLEDERNR